MRALVVCLIWSSAAFSQSLGPKDGRDLPAADVNRVQVGLPAPDFTLETSDGKTVTLSGFRNNQRVVLVFYRGQW